jgi:phthalate 4,5-dioxygenase
VLIKEENELVTRVGRGTPMGEVMRRYWIPALLSRDLPGPDSPPMRVKLLGEDLVAFRDSEGKVGLLDEFCPHRLASLFLGRNEESGLRCVYHGWKFDTAGNCVDMPSEPATSSFKERIHLLAYPVVECGGVIWTYMGPPEKQPAPPDYEWVRAPETHTFVSKTLEYANYLQAIEGGIDTAHSSFLHNNNLADRSGFRQIDTSPRLVVEKTDYGFRYASLRDIGDDSVYLRVYQFFMPFQQFRSHQLDGRKGHGRGELPRVQGHIWVPQDDYTTIVYNWTMSVDEDKPFTEEIIVKQETSAGRGPGMEQMVRTRVRANDWLIDREAQRTKTFTGIVGLNTQDLAVQESMGAIVDRSREHLGTTDLAVIAMRQIMVDAARNIQLGIDPPGLDPETYRHARGTDAIIPSNVPWEEAVAQELVAKH